MSKFTKKCIFTIFGDCVYQKKAVILQRETDCRHRIGAKR